MCETEPGTADMITQRNAPCPCNSGRKYKDCHLQIDQAHTAEEKYSAAQAVYARNWRTTAQHHFAERHYHWLAEQLKPFGPRRLLDVGSGSGHGLIALLETLGSDLQVIGLDENEACLQIARQTLIANGHAPVLNSRISRAETRFGIVQRAPEIAEPITAQLALVEGDVCNDPHLVASLLSIGRFDAVTIWLTGTHMLRQWDTAVRAAGVESEGTYRLYVQNSAYELADRILKVGGVLQVADRGEAPKSDHLRNDVLEAHREQALGTSLEVRDLAFRVYKQPESRRTPMGVTPGTSGRRPPPGFEAAIVSTVAVKRGPP